MARARKQAEEIVDVELEIDDAPQTPLPIMVKTREVREFIAPMVMPSQAEPDNVVTVEELPPQYAAPEAETMESRLRKEVGLTGDRWSMTVYRLLKYHADGNASLNGNATVICTKPFDLDSYVDTVLESCVVPDKPNDFLVIVRRNNRVYCHLPVIRAEAIARPEQPTTQQGQINNAIPAAVVDPFAEMKKAMAFIKSVRELESPPQPQAAPAGEISTESAILKVIASDPEQVAKIAKRLLPGDSSEDAMPGWLQALIPLITPLLAQIAGRFLTPQPQAEPQAPGQPAQLEPQQPPPQFLQYQELIKRVIYGIENGLAPDFVAEEIATFCERDAVLASFCEPLITTPPALLQTQLAQLAPKLATMLQKPESLEWLIAMQAYFQGGEDEPTSKP